MAREMSCQLRVAGFRVTGYVAADRQSVGQSVGEGLVVAADEDLDELAGLVMVGIGHPAIRVALWPRVLAAPNLVPLTSVHPSALADARLNVIGAGCYLAANVIVTTDAVIGDDVILNMAATVGHDAVVGPHSVVNPVASVSGGSRIGTGVLVGTGARILENVQVGDGSVVGAGAVVTRDVPPGVTVVGVPARIVER